MILFVDDEVDVVSVYTEALEYAFPDHSIRGVTDFDAACDLASGLGPDELALVCVDEALSAGRSGLDLVHSIRNQFPKVPALLYTGKATSETAERAYQADVSVLWKPMSLNSYIREVKKRL